jgi:hypothetical protein
METVLVVVPWRRTSAYLYCLERAISLKLNGKNVLFLDLSSLNEKFATTSFRRMIRPYTHRNISSKIYKQILQKHCIPEIVWADFQRQNYETLPSTGIHPVFERALRSQFAASFGHSSISVGDLPTKLVDKAALSFSEALRVVRMVLQEYRIDKLVTVNGRFVVDAASVFISRELGIETELLESTDRPLANRVNSFKSTPQSVAENRKKMLRTWKIALLKSQASAILIADSVIQNRLSPNWIWRKNNLQIVKFEPNSYIAFFPTSDVEFAIFESEEDLPWHLNQTEVFRLIATKAVELGKKVVVRVHPQLSNEVRGLMEDKIWQDLCLEHNAICIVSSEPVDSLELAKFSYHNIVFASSIALEIGYLGYPILVTAPTIFSSLVSECEALDKTSILKALESPSTFHNREQIRPYLYYEKMAGDSFRHFDVPHLDTVFYEGNQLDQLLPLYRICLKPVLWARNFLRMRRFGWNPLRSLV